MNVGVSMALPHGAARDYVFLNHTHFFSCVLVDLPCVPVERSIL